MEEFVCLQAVHSACMQKLMQIPRHYISMTVAMGGLHLLHSTDSSSRIPSKISHIDEVRGMLIRWTGWTHCSHGRESVSSTRGAFVSRE